MPPMLFPHICVLGSVHPFYSFQLQNQSPREASVRRGFHSSQKLGSPTLDVPFLTPQILTQILSFLKGGVGGGGHREGQKGP